MAERKKAKKTEATTAKSRPEPVFVGATLRAARLEKKMKIDDVSHAINIRPSQITAIEENDIESLPGMTYAVGFVRAYANFLGLNGAEIVHRFKAEQGHEQPQADLKFPEPITESRVPSPVMVGIGAALAVIVLVGWTIYSSMHNSDKTATQVPPAPVVASMTSTPAAPSAPVAMPVAPVANAQAVPPATTVPETPLVAGAPETAPMTPSSRPVTAAPATVAAEDNAATPAVQEPQAETVPVKAVLANAAPIEKTAVAKKKRVPVIRIRAPRSRVTLRATEASWVQVSTLQGRVIYRKVLRQGEQYDVPDQPDLVLDTANAGGLEVFVDGKRVQNIGKEGEILSGVDLTPASLKIKREAIRG